MHAELTPYPSLMIAYMYENDSTKERGDVFDV